MLKIFVGSGNLHVDTEYFGFFLDYGPIGLFGEVVNWADSKNMAEQDRFVGSQHFLRASGNLHVETECFGFLSTTSQSVCYLGGGSATPNLGKKSCPAR